MTHAHDREVCTRDRSLFSLLLDSDGWYVLPSFTYCIRTPANSSMTREFGRSDDLRATSIGSD